MSRDLAILLSLLVIAFGVWGCREVSGPTGDPRPIVSERRVEALRGLAARDDLNLLFVLVDTLRADRLQLYGYPRPTSPTMDYLGLAGGIVFQRHHAQSSWTKCSMASLWTGLYPVRTGVLRADDVLPEDAVLAAERLREAGFRTAGLWRNGWVGPQFGFAQGFDTYTKPRGGPLPASVRRENPNFSSTSTDVDLVLGASSFLRINGHERWFLYLHLMDLHEYLYDEDSAKFGTAYSDVYDNSILRTNHVLEQLIGNLAAQGQLEKTIVVLASDHGEAFGEHGREGHAQDVHAESTHVPWIVSLPFRFEEPVLVYGRTENVDVWPTLYELLGLPPVEGVDGISAVPLIQAAIERKPVAQLARATFSYLDQSWGRLGRSPRPLVAVADGSLRLYHHAAGQNRDTLYDVRKDRVEGRDLHEQRAEDAVRLEALAKTHLEQVPPWGRAPQLELSEMELNNLRALGYKIR